VRILVGWRQRLEKAVAGESVVYMARRIFWCDVTTKVPLYEWKGVVPEQTASAAHFEADELEEMYKAHEVDGWEIVGHMHIHPSGMTGRSITDTEDWEGVPGLYITAPRETDAFGVFASCGGCVFDVYVLKVAKDVVAEEVPMLGQAGEADWGKMIKPPRAIVTQWMGGQQYEGPYDYQGRRGNGRVRTHFQDGRIWTDEDERDYQKGYDAMGKDEEVRLCTSCRGLLGNVQRRRDVDGGFHQYCPWCGTIQVDAGEVEVEEELMETLEDGRGILELREAEVRMSEGGELLIVGWPAYDAGDWKMTQLCMVDDLAVGDNEAVKQIKRFVDSAGL